MKSETFGRGPVLTGLYELLNPLPLGFFAAAWLFDIIYLYSARIFWTQAASWLIVLGLFIAIIPRLLNLFLVWSGNTHAFAPVKVHFWLSLIAIVLAIINAFIHSRDAWAVVPLGVTLSTLVVALLTIANLQQALRDNRA
ncbi:hypothetical protein GIX45_13915 [Erwinia sp. CPCC 100877]|nr:hypothetical protein [Erwinia sp. CPCC 100877]